MLTSRPLAMPTASSTVTSAAMSISAGGRKMRMNVYPNVELSELRPGQEVVLNEALNVVIAQSYETVGEIVMLKEVLADYRPALVISQADEERVVRLAEPEVIDKRRTEADVQAARAAALPGALGAILGLIAGVLAELPGATVNNAPRMADSRKCSPRSTR